MDLFGRERARLRDELAGLKTEKAGLQEENERLHDNETKLKAKQQRTAAGAVKRQDKIVELERIIDQLKADLQSCRVRNAPASEINAVAAALHDAEAIHSRSTR